MGAPIVTDPGRPTIGAVRDNQRLDQAALERWFRANVADPAGPLQLSQFQRGASNPTYLLTACDGPSVQRWVLRKKPPGTLLASAHQVDREFRVMQALGGIGFPVPTMRALCEDDTVIGTAFYVMDFLDGRIFRDARLPGMAPAERAAIYDNLNATLARLHQVDFSAIGLADYGKPGNYFARQVDRNTTRRTVGVEAGQDRVAEVDRGAHPPRRRQFRCRVAARRRRGVGTSQQRSQSGAAQKPPVR